MSMHETGYIRNTLKQNGPVEQPHYDADSYLSGERIECGFEASGEPEHEECHVGIAAKQFFDPEPHYMKNRPTERTQTVHVGSALDFSKPAEEPHYMQQDGVSKRAKAIAKAVELAIENGDISPDDLL